MLDVTVRNHPFKDEFLKASVPLEQTIVEIIGRETMPAIIIADGEYIPAERWATTKPLTKLYIHRLPANRDILRSLGFLALAIFAPYAGAGLAGAFGFAATTAAGATTLAASLFTAGVGLVGALALNALIPPTLPSIDGAGGYGKISAITGQSNQVAAFAPIPRVYGTREFYPPIPMTGLPFTELVGEDQYIRMLVVLGYGPLDIGGVTAGAGEALITEATSLTGTPIKIGGTAIDQFTDVEFEIGDPDDVTLFTSSVVEDSVNTAIDGAGDPTTENDTVSDNVSLTRTTDTDTDEISLEVYFPALFTVSGQGNTRWCRVTFTVERSPAGAGTWTTLGTFTVASNERKPIRRGVRYVLPAAGEYDIRLTRDSTFYMQENEFFSDATWTVLRSIKRNIKPFDVDDTVVMALRIKATDQIGGRVDRLSIEATSILPSWNGSSWVDTVTRNPAWVYADIFSGVAARSPVAKSRLDTTALLAWANWANSQGLYYDEVLDADGTVLDRAREVASTGLASWHVTDAGLISVIRDQGAVTPSMIVTPRNSYGFTEEHAYPDIPHALRVQFWDADRGEPTERIVYDDGYNAGNATKYQQITTIGVTEPDQAWKIGRFHLAQLRLRPETYTFSQDIQHLAYERGATLELAHDVILVGLKWGRIKSIIVNGSNEVTGAEVDELLYMEVIPNYALKIQRQDGSIITEGIVNVSPYTQNITFDTPIAEYDYGSGNETGIKVGDHFTFGESDSESIKVKVVRIDPQGDFKARMTCVPAAEDIYDAWTGTIPTFDPVITDPIDLSLLPPVQPVIVLVSSDSPPSPVGAPRRRLVIGFSMPPGLVGVTVEARTRLRETTADGELTTGWIVSGSADSQAGVIFIAEVEEDQIYDVQIRSRRDGRVSPWTSTVQHTIGDSGWLSEPGATEGATVGTNLYNANGGVVSDSVITNFDDASALGFNSAFADWTGTFPVGWGAYGVAVSDISQETTIKLTGPYAVKFTCDGSNSGIVRTATISYPQDSIVIGSVDIYIESVTSGSPGVVVDMLMNGSTAHYRKNVSANNAITGTWQRVYFKVSQNDYSSTAGTVSDPCNAIRIYLMGSWTTLGAFTGEVIFDNLRFAILSPNIENEAQLWADISGAGLPEDNATNNTGVLADQDTVGQFDIDLYAAHQTAYAQTETQAITEATWQTIETVNLGPLPANITDSVVAIEVSFSIFGADSITSAGQALQTWDARLLDDDSAIVDQIEFYVYRITNTINDGFVSSHIIGTNISLTFLVGSANLNAGEVNTFTFQVQIGTIGFSPLSAKYITMKAILLNQAE